MTDLLRETASQTAGPSRSCTRITPVSPPLRRSSIHCIASRAWKSIGSEPPTPTIRASSISQPDGISTGGSLHVTGNDEPASIGNRRRRDVSTIAFALAKLYDRCLSLKTGTALPSDSKRSAAWRKNSNRG